MRLPHLAARKRDSRAFFDRNSTHQRNALPVTIEQKGEEKKKGQKRGITIFFFFSHSPCRPLTGDGTWLRQTRVCMTSV